MKKNKRILVTLFVITVLLFLFLRGSFNFFGGPSNPEATKSPSSLVKTAPIVIKSLSREIQAYGKVTPAPGATTVISVPFESSIINIFVSNGQMIASGELLLSIQPSLNATLLLSQAQTTLDSKRLSLDHLNDQYKLKLTTNDQILNAKEAYRQAVLNLEKLHNQGISKDGKILASEDGLVKSVSVQQGAIVPAGASLVELVIQNRFEVILGVEPEDIWDIQVGQEVFLSQVNASSRGQFKGTIRKLSYEVNPASGLVDIFVSIPSSVNLLLGEYILGTLKFASQDSLVVPRPAVLTDGNNRYLFTIQNGRALEHRVQLGIENESEIGVTSESLREGDSVVVVGNYELKDGMDVRLESDN